MKWKIVAVASVLIALVSLAIAFLTLHTGAFRKLDAPSIVTQIKPLNQLTTVRYSIQRVVGVTEMKDPIGEESLLLMVQGEVLAGLDLNELTETDIKYLNRDYGQYSFACAEDSGSVS